jgi:hypothetical protein
MLPFPVPQTQPETVRRARSSKERTLTGIARIGEV